MTRTPKETPANDKPAEVTADPKSAEEPKAKAEKPEAEAPAAEAAEGAVAGPRQGGGLVAVIVAVVVIGGALAATYPHWSVYVDKLRGPATMAVAPSASPQVTAPTAEAASAEKTPEPTEEKDAVKDAVGDVVAADQPTTPDVDPVVAALGDISERLQGLEDRLAALESAPSMAGPMAEVTEKLAVLEDVASRLTALEQRASNTAFGAGPLVFAIDRLRDAVKSAAPFRPALDAVKALVGDDATLATIVGELEPFADTGVASVEQIRRSFDAAATQVSRVTPLPGGDSWWERALNQVAGLISVRKVDGMTTADPRDQALALAETALAAGDVDGALAAVSSLKGEGLVAWRGQAEDRAKVNRAVQALAGHVSRLMVPVAGEGKP